MNHMAGEKVTHFGYLGSLRLFLGVKNDLRNFEKYKLDSTDRIDFKIRFQQQRNRVYIFVSFT